MSTSPCIDTYSPLGAAIYQYAKSFTVIQGHTQHFKTNYFILLGISTEGKKRFNINFLLSAYDDFPPGKAIWREF